MQSINKINLLTILFGLSFLFVQVSVSSCQKIKLNKDQRTILDLYSSHYLDGKDQKNYYKSEHKKLLTEILEVPLTVEDFKLPEIALAPGTEEQKPDTLFREKELKSWSKQVSSYSQQIWNQSLFSKRVQFISEEEIPAYREKTAIPPEGKIPISIHYLSVPFIYDGKSAMLYSRVSEGGGSVQVKYYYFKKMSDKWSIIAEGPLTVMY